MTDVKWSLSAKEVQDSLDENMGTLVKDLMRQIFTEIAEATPVYTGSARASWRIDVDRIDSTESINEDPNTPLAPAAFPESFPSKLTYKEINITNQRPYIYMLEHGWSKQAPNGMVQVTLNKYAL